VINTCNIIKYTNENIIYYDKVNIQVLETEPLKMNYFIYFTDRYFQVKGSQFPSPLLTKRIKKKNWPTQTYQFLDEKGFVQWTKENTTKNALLNTFISKY
jgi:hypothetical protein